MAKEYLGIDAVNDLFDIIDENYVSKEEIAERDKSIASAMSVGAALIASSILKLAESVSSLQINGYESGIEVADDSDIDNILDKYFDD